MQNAEPEHLCSWYFHIDVQDGTFKRTVMAKGICEACEVIIRQVDARLQAVLVMLGVQNPDIDIEVEIRNGIPKTRNNRN